MKVFEIKAETIKQTKKCLYDFDCLKNDNWNTCIIEKKT